MASAVTDGGVILAAAYKYHILGVTDIAAAA